jgi:virginiamycin B lyase
VKKKVKQLMVAAFFGVILLTSTLALSLNSLNPPPTNEEPETPEASLTGTPADNYPVKDRVTFCGTNSTKSNRYITEFGLPTYCAQPLAITTDSSGIVWFTQYNTGNIATFDPLSKIFTEYQNDRWPKGDQSMMWGIASTSDGNIWYTDETHDVIWKFDRSNFTSFKYPLSQAGQTFPQKIVIDGKNILVNDFTGNKITSFDSSQSGSEIQYSIINSPTNDTFTSLASNSDKDIWYTIWKFQTGGALARYDPLVSNGPSFNLPLGIAAPNGISSTPDNKVWITDAGTSFFFSFDPESEKFTKFITSEPPKSSYGNSTGLIKTPISRPYWNQVDDKGRLWFNEQTANSIAVFDPPRETLVEYLVPSKNPLWVDCSGLVDCGIAQVLDFTIDGEKVWFTEWVQNNIAVLDSSIPLPINVSTDANSITLNRGENFTVLFTVTPNEQLDYPIALTFADTANLNDITVTGNSQITIENDPVTVPVTISADKFALSGSYKVLLGARNQDLTVSQYVTVTIS